MKDVVRFGGSCLAEVNLDEKNVYYEFPCRCNKIEMIDRIEARNLTGFTRNGKDSDTKSILT